MHTRTHDVLLVVVIRPLLRRSLNVRSVLSRNLNARARAPACVHVFVCRFECVARHTHVSTSNDDTVGIFVCCFRFAFVVFVSSAAAAPSGAVARPVCRALVGAVCRAVPCAAHSHSPKPVGWSLCVIACRCRLPCAACCCCFILLFIIIITAESERFLNALSGGLNAQRSTCSIHQSEMIARRFIVRSQYA